MRARLTVVAALAACSNHSSRLDKVEKPATLSLPDPWAGSGAKPGKGDDDNGFDLQGALAKIKDAVEKPGPYEMPEASADYDDGKPHWGVLTIHGDIVEREAFSW